VSQTPLTVTILETAAEDLQELPLRDSGRILARIERYAKGEPSDIKKLQGRGEFRLRVGDYRVLFVKSGNNVDIQRILHRREAYR
jgi:mRNA interferase RelE/StbE